MSAPPPPPDLAGLTLLVVNDDINTGEILATFLRACGATVLSAETVAAALAYLDEPRKVDAVGADIAPPGIVELARKLRGDPRRNRLPIVALTGRSDHPNRHAFDALVRKPVDLDDLAATIASLTRR